MRALKLAAIAVTSLALVACSDTEGSRHFLVDQGYTNIEMLGDPWFSGCPNDDVYHDEFRAIGLSGRPVHGVVCTSSGWSGAQHLRFYDR